MGWDDEISIWWCLGDTWRCTHFEAAGIWSVILFYSTMLVVTVCHGVRQSVTGSAARNESATMRHTATDIGEDGRMLCWVMVYFFSFAAGSILWVIAGVGWVHPIQIWWVQLLGSALLVACAILFVASHVHLGENWSPEPEQKARHQLITHGVFQYARHPMYAIFLWAAIGTFLATLNWLIAWIVFGSVVMTLRRIETEERILVELFGHRYLEYRRCVTALGPPWRWLGYDREWPVGYSEAQPPAGASEVTALTRPASAGRRA